MHNSIRPSLDNSYSIWLDRSTLADCLRELRLDNMAKKVLDLSISEQLIDGFLSIIKREAQRLQRQDVMDRLYISGLI